MSNSQESQSWSDNPNAPNIPYYLYSYEKTCLGGILVGSILYGMPKAPPPTNPSICAHSVCSVYLGIVIVLFFRCTAALLNPVHRRGEPIRWGLVSYIAIMFSVVTVLTAMEVNVQSISYIDNRNFPGIEGVLPPGPAGYQWLISPEAINVVPNVMFNLCNWLADGLLVSSLFDTPFTYPNILP